MPTRHSDSSRHAIAPGWSANTKLPEAAHLWAIISIGDKSVVQIPISLTPAAGSFECNRL